jgi:hypothetical protein
MSSKYFIWIVHAPMCLWEFSWNFGNFLSIFRALKHFLEFTRIVFAPVIFSENNINKSYLILSGRARGLDPACSDPHPPAQPAKAHLGMATRGHGGHGTAPPPSLGVRATPVPPLAPIKSRPRAPRALAALAAASPRLRSMPSLLAVPAAASLFRRPFAVRRFCWPREQADVATSFAPLSRVHTPLPVAGGAPERHRMWHI